MATLTVTKTDEVTPYLTGLVDQLPGSAETLLDDIGGMFMDFMTTYNPVDTGAMMDETTMDVETLFRLIYSGVYYFPFVVLGTGPHPISSPVFINGVGWRYIGTHPGTRANDYPFLAFMDGMHQAESMADQWLDNLLEG